MSRARKRASSSPTPRRSTTTRAQDQPARVLIVHRLGRDTAAAAGEPCIWSSCAEGDPAERRRSPAAPGRSRRGSSGGWSSPGWSAADVSLMGRPSVGEGPGHRCGATRSRSSSISSRSPRRATPVTASAPAARTSSGGADDRAARRRGSPGRRASTSRPRIRPRTSTTTTRDSRGELGGVEAEAGADLHHRQHPAAEVHDAADVRAAHAGTRVMSATRTTSRTSAIGTAYSSRSSRKITRCSSRSIGRGRRLGRGACTRSAKVEHARARVSSGSSRPSRAAVDRSHRRCRPVSRMQATRPSPRIVAAATVAGRPRAGSSAFTTTSWWPSSASTSRPR